jgi:hypothetical protein
LCPTQIFHKCIGFGLGLNPSSNFHYNSQFVVKTKAHAVFLLLSFDLHAFDLVSSLRLPDVCKSLPCRFTLVINAWWIGDSTPRRRYGLRGPTPTVGKVVTFMIYHATETYFFLYSRTSTTLSILICNLSWLPRLPQFYRHFHLHFLPKSENGRGYVFSFV